MIDHTGRNFYLILIPNSVTDQNDLTQVLYLRAFARSGPHRKHSFPSIVVSIRVYKAVAWQRVDQICYII
jgi:hypothetical protein